MNREDIIRMAREAKFATEEWGDGLHHVCVFNFQGSETEITEELQRFATLVASAEREACARVCEDSVEYAGDELAKQIRNRGQA
jgi:hypothetical protein